MKKFIRLIALSLGLTLFSSTSATATVLTPGTWDSFSFGAAGSTVSETYDFTVGSGMSLFVTDAFCIGDRFSLSFGDTSLVAVSPCGTPGELTDAQEAYDSGLYSTAQFILSAGTYTGVTIDVLASPFGGGGAYIKIDETVPEPSILLLLGAGMIGLVGLRRRKA